jgi:hypothetical protein
MQEVAGRIQQVHARLVIIALQERSLGRIHRLRKQQRLVTSLRQELPFRAHVLAVPITHILLSQRAFPVRLADIALPKAQALRPIAVLDTGAVLRPLRGRPALLVPRAQRLEQLRPQTVLLVQQANIAPTTLGQLPQETARQAPSASLEQPSRPTLSLRQPPTTVSVLWITTAVQLRPSQPIAVMANGVLLLVIAPGPPVSKYQVIVPCAQQVNTVKPPRRRSRRASALRATTALLVARLQHLWPLLAQLVASAQQAPRPRLYVLRARISQRRPKVPASFALQVCTASKVLLAELLVEPAGIALRQLAQQQVSRARLAPTAAVGQEPQQSIVCLAILVAIARLQAWKRSEMAQLEPVKPAITVP